MQLEAFYVIPQYTFFYWGFTLPKKLYPTFIQHFSFQEGNLVQPIQILIENKRYPAKIRMARINNKGSFEGRSNNKWRERDVIQLFYDSEYDTLKALRKLFIYSYASTIDKKKPKLKELLELEHINENQFKLKVVAKQETDFDEMFRFMEDKNLFKFWKDKNSSKSKKQDRIILDYAKSWINVDELSNYKARNNVIYLLFHSEDNHLYVGKANNLGSRVQKDIGRIGLKSNWDKFMWFEINPEYNAFIEELEHFLIRTFASLIKNNLDLTPIIDHQIQLVNKQLKKHKI